MSDTATIPAASGGAGAPLPEALRAALSVRFALLAAPIVAVMAWLFWDWLARQHRWSSSSEDWTHAYMVPAVSLYILWVNRESLRGVKPSVYWPGVLPIVVGVYLYYFFLIGYPNHMFAGGGIVLTVFGVALALGGPALARRLFVPIAYLGFAVTVSEMVMTKATFALQNVAAVGAHRALSLIVPTEISGNTLNLVLSSGREVPLNIAEACSGMRMVVAFIALGVAVAFVACRHWWQRVALIAMAVPVAIVTNIVRIASLGIASIWNPDLATGDAHMFIGTLWLIPGFFLFMGIVWALNRILVEPATGDEAKGAAA